MLLLTKPHPFIQRLLDEKKLSRLNKHTKSTKLCWTVRKSLAGNSRL